MKQLSATSRTTVAAPMERCFELLADIDSYPRWFPSGVRSAEVTERGEGGLPTRARAALHLSHGPLTKDFRLSLEVTAAPPRSIRLARIANHPRDHEALTVAWRLSAGGPSGGGPSGGELTTIELDLTANLSVPPFLPVGGVADSLAQGFVRAAADELRRQR